MSDNVSSKSHMEEEKAVWRRIPAPEPVMRDTVWHYTDGLGLLGILRSRRFWATSASMLNDSTELTYGLHLAEKIAKEFLRHELPPELKTESFMGIAEAAFDALRTNNIFVICASTDGDDLAQWRGYSAGAGYAIGIRTSDELRMIDTSRPLAFVEREDSFSKWRKVVYDPPAQRSMMIETLRFVADMAHYKDSQPPEVANRAHQLGVGVLTTAVAYLKHPGFKAEREARYLIDTRRFDHLIQFRPSTLGITPYVEAGVGLDPAYADGNPTGERRRATTCDPGGTAIDRICIGPAQNQATARHGLETALRALGYMEVLVTESKVPFR